MQSREESVVVAQSKRTAVLVRCSYLSSDRGKRRSIMETDDASAPGRILNYRPWAETRLPVNLYKQVDKSGLRY
jgi:hypothetical protein